MPAPLTEKDYLELVRLTSTNSGRESEEGQVIASNPALMAEITRRMQEFTTATAAPQLAENLNTVIAGPGAANTSLIGGATDTAIGVGVLGMDILRAITPDDSEINAKLTRGRNALAQKRLDFEAETDAKIDAAFGDTELSATQSLAAKGLPKFAGEVLPLLVMPSGLSTYWRTVGYNGLIGAGIGGISDKEAVDLRDRLGEMSLTGLATAGISGVLHAPSGFRAYAARKVNKQLESDISKANIALEKEVQRITGDPEFSFGLGQITANPFIVGLQTGSAKAALRAHQNQQMTTLIDAFKFRANSLSTGGNVDKIAGDLNKTILEINKQMNKRFTTAFGDGLDNIAAQWGDDVVFDGLGYLAAAKKALERFTDPYLGGSAAPKFLVNQITKMEKEIAETGGISATSLTKLFQSFRNISKDGLMLEGASPMAAKSLAGELEAGLMNSLDDAAMTNPEAVAAIQNLRSIYAFEKAQQSAVNNRLLAGVFGVEDAAAINAQTAFARIEGLSEQGQREMMGTLRNLDRPDLVLDIQAEKIRQVVKNSFVPNAPQSFTPYSPDLLARQLAGKSGSEAGAMRGLFDPREALQLKRTGQALRTINETYLTAFPEASGTMLQEGTINIVSRSAEFFGRWMTKLLTNGTTVERMLIDPAFRDSIITVANKGLGNKASQSALIYMMMTANEWAMSDESDRRADALADARQGAAQDLATNPAFAN